MPSVARRDFTITIYCANTVTVGYHFPAVIEKDTHFSDVRKSFNSGKSIRVFFLTDLRVDGLKLDATHVSISAQEKAEYIFHQHSNYVKVCCACITLNLLCKTIDTVRTSLSLSFYIYLKIVNLLKALIFTLPRWNNISTEGWFHLVLEQN